MSCLKLSEINGFRLIAQLPFSTAFFLRPSRRLFSVPIWQLIPPLNLRTVRLGNFNAQKLFDSDWVGLARPDRGGERRGHPDSWTHGSAVLRWRRNHQNGFTINGTTWSKRVRRYRNREGSLASVYAAPLGMGTNQTTGATYMAVEGGGTRLAAPATPQTSLSLYWGSMDGKPFNMNSFAVTIDNYTLAGADLVAMGIEVGVGAPATNSILQANQLVTITGLESLSRLRRSTSTANAFRVQPIITPTVNQTGGALEPSRGAMMMVGFAGLGCAAGPPEHEGSSVGDLIAFASGACNVQGRRRVAPSLFCGQASASSNNPQRAPGLSAACQIKNSNIAARDRPPPWSKTSIGRSPRRSKGNFPTRSTATGLTRQARRRTAGSLRRARQCSFGQLSSTSPNCNGSSMWRSSLRTLGWAVASRQSRRRLGRRTPETAQERLLIVQKAMSTSACFTAAATRIDDRYAGFDPARGSLAVNDVGCPTGRRGRRPSAGACPYRSHTGRMPIRGSTSRSTPAGAVLMRSSMSTRITSG